MPPGVVQRRGLLPDARHVLDHDHVGHVGQRDRAVVVDEDGQRRLARARAAARPAAADRPACGPGRSRPSPARRRDGPRDASRVNATPRMMIPPPTTWTGRIGSCRKIAASTTAIAGTSDCSVMTRVGPSSRTPWKTTTFARAAASSPEKAIAKHDLGRAAACSGAERAGRQQLADADRREDERPADRGPRRQHERGVRGAGPRARERGVGRPAQGGRHGQREPDRRAAQLDPDAGRDDQHDPDEGQDAPRPPCSGLSVSVPKSDGDDRGEDRARGDQQGGVAGRDALEAHRPQHLVEAEAQSAQQQDPTGVGPRQPDLPSDQRRIPSSARDARQ